MARSLSDIPPRILAQFLRLLDNDDLNSIAHVNRALFDLTWEERLMRAWKSGNVGLTEGILHLHPNPPKAITECIVTMLDNAMRTPVSYAAERGHTDTLVALLDYGIKHGVQDWKERTPLSYAAEGGHVVVIGVLLDRGAKHHSQDWTRRTALSYAAAEGHDAAAKLLLDYGADCTVQDRDGRTPLSYAAERGHLKTVILLLDSGSNPAQIDFNGQTPLNYAAREGHVEIAQLLIKRSKGALTPDTGSIENSERVIAGVHVYDARIFEKDTTSSRDNIELQFGTALELSGWQSHSISSAIDYTRSPSREIDKAQE